MRSFEEDLKEARGDVLLEQMRQAIEAVRAMPMPELPPGILQPYYPCHGFGPQPEGILPRGIGQNA